MSCGIFFMPAGRQDPHGVMAALTYARRGSLMAACGLAPEDDDGNSATGKKGKPSIDPKVQDAMNKNNIMSKGE